MASTTPQDKQVKPGGLKPGKPLVVTKGRANTMKKVLGALVFSLFLAGTAAAQIGYNGPAGSGDVTDGGMTDGFIPESDGASGLIDSPLSVVVTTLSLGAITRTQMNAGGSYYRSAGIRGTAELAAIIWDTNPGTARFGPLTEGTATFLITNEVDDLVNHQDLSLSVVDGTATIACLEDGTGADACDIHLLALGAAGVSIGAATDADGTGLHVFEASAGAVTANTNADTIIAENDANGGISILTPDANVASLYFGSPSDNIGALLNYQHNGTPNGRFEIGTHHSAGTLHFETAVGIEAMVMDAVQGTTFTPAATGVIALASSVEGGTGNIHWFWAWEKHTLAASTSSTTTLSPAIASGDIVHGCLKTVDTTVVDDAGDDTWSAAWDASLASTAMNSAIAAAQNTKSNFLFAPLKATGVAQVVFTPQGGSFSAGVIEIQCLVQSTTNMANA